jgi:molybdopterin-containing oxidoreductase family iron-sulfur binding subunit
MSGYQLNRRTFLKLMGWSAAGTTLAGCDLPSTVTLEEGVEDVVSYLSPVEYAIPGVGVWYASTCLQCPSVCGIHGKVREGRALKLEGNPASPMNHGKLCQMGQASIQGHYNPDRLTRPLLNKDGKLTPIGWDEAWQLILDKVGPVAGLSGERFAWMTGTVSGHQAVLLDSFMQSIGSGHHFVHEVIAPSVLRAVQQDMLGEAMPRMDLDNAKLIVSFGADFLGSWVAPLHFSTEYAKFRSAPRGVLVQIEPKMTLTGSNADLWVAIRPGTEGVLALGIAHVLQQQGVDVPAHLAGSLTDYAPARVAEITGVAAERIEQIAALLKQHSPSLVLSGAPVEGHAHGYAASAAVLMLNSMLGNIGTTLLSSGDFPFPQLVAKAGGTRDLLAFAELASNKGLDVAFFYGANPLYTAPSYLKMNEALQNIPFKVAFSQFPDETTLAADLIVPISSTLESWGTHVGAYQPSQGVIHVQQPLMERLYPNTVGLGDLLIRLLKPYQVTAFEVWGDYYTYLRSALSALPGEHRAGELTDEQFWNKALQTGVIEVSAVPKDLALNAVDIVLPEYVPDLNYPLHLVPYAQLGLWDGRNANLPWLQEAPDQISKVVWDTWAELHPSTAAKFGVEQGDMLEISSEQGSIQAVAYIFKGIHPDVIGVPMGQGHEEYGRYAKGRGANLFKILNPVTDARTGELALYATRVKITNKGKRDTLVIEGHGHSDQLGRKLVATISAAQFDSLEGA